MVRWLAWLLMAGCGPEWRLQIADTPKPLAEAVAAGATAWSFNEGSMSVRATGSNQYPSPLTLRMQYVKCEPDNGHSSGGDCAYDIASASIEVAPGLPCALAEPATCSANACYAELVMTEPGNCLVQVRATPSDGTTDKRCWYLANYEADDPFDQTQFAMLDATTQRQHRDCESDL